MKLLTCFFFMAGIAIGNLRAQNNAHSAGIDVSGKSPIYFDTRTVSPAQMQQVNDEHHSFMLSRDPQWDGKRAQYEEQLQQYVAHARMNPHTQSVITIPVVVHIIYNTAVQNVPDAAVYS